MSYTPNSRGVTSFSVASSPKYTTGAGERREETEWFNCQAWGKLAETTPNAANRYIHAGIVGLAEKSSYVDDRTAASLRWREQGCNDAL